MFYRVLKNPIFRFLFFIRRNWSSINRSLSTYFFLVHNDTKMFVFHLNIASTAVQHTCIVSLYACLHESYSNNCYKKDQKGITTNSLYYRRENSTAFSCSPPSRRKLCFSLVFFIIFLTLSLILDFFPLLCTERKDSPRYCNATKLYQQLKILCVLYTQTQHGHKKITLEY